MKITHISKNIQNCNIPVCDGLVFLVKNPDKTFWKKGDLMVTGNENYFISTQDINQARILELAVGRCPVSPIIVSPNEPIVRGDRVYDMLAKKVFIANNNYKNSEDQQYFKVIAFVRYFSDTHLEMIVKNELKNGDKVSVVCTEIDDTDDQYEIETISGFVNFFKQDILPIKSFIVMLTNGETYEHVPTILIVNGPNKEFVVNNIDIIKKEQDIDPKRYSIYSIKEIDLTLRHILVTDGFTE